MCMAFDCNPQIYFVVFFAFELNQFLSDYKNVQF